LINELPACLGKPVRQASSNNIDVKLYTYSESGYKGYALKVDLKTSKSNEMVLGKDKLGAVRLRYRLSNAMGNCRINAGGFADGRGGRYPTGNTILTTSLFLVSLHLTEDCRSLRRVKQGFEAGWWQI